MQIIDSCLAVWYDDYIGASLRGCPLFFYHTAVTKRYSRRGRRPRRPPACSWLSFFCDAAHHRVVGDADPYDPQKKNAGLPPQPDPTYNLTSTHAPITACQRRLAAENDPWRFRQQSSRVISIQFWYLTSLVTSLSVGSDPFVLHNGYAKLVFFRRVFKGLFWLLLSWEPVAYLYIGITSLYLNHSTLP